MDPRVLASAHQAATLPLCPVRCAPASQSISCSWNKLLGLRGLFLLRGIILLHPRAWPASFRPLRKCYLFKEGETLFEAVCSFPSERLTLLNLSN